MIQSSIPRRRSIHPLDSSRSNLFRPRRLATRSYPSRRVHFSRSTMNKGDDARRRRDAPTPLRRIPSIHPSIHPRTRSRWWKCLDKGVENVTREINNRGYNKVQIQLFSSRASNFTRHSMKIIFLFSFEEASFYLQTVNGVITREGLVKIDIIEGDRETCRGGVEKEKRATWLRFGPTRNAFFSTGE